MKDINVQDNDVSSNAIGFWALVSIVISSELGASIFLLPKELANYGIYGIVGWIIGGIGAILIAVTFALLCSQTSSIGSSSTYISICFGKKIGFFCKLGILVCFMGMQSHYYSNRSRLFISVDWHCRSNLKTCNGNIYSVDANNR